MSKGQIAWNKGKHCISPMQGKHHSEETKKKIALAHQGKFLSKEHKLKISKSLMGNQRAKGHSSPKKGKYLSDKTCKLMKQNHADFSGNRNPRWKGGKRNTGRRNTKYFMIYKPEHPYANKNYVYEHRLVMEESIGRVLKPFEIVHHINNNPFDNRIENLMLFHSNSSHLKFHKLSRQRS